MSETVTPPRRDLAHHPRDITEVGCPGCQGDGQHHGPVPYRNCLRCGGYGTILFYEKPEQKEESV